MCISNLANIKKSIEKDIKEIELKRRIELMNSLGEPLSKYDIVDRREMTPELIGEFHMALDPKSDSIRSVIPSSEKPRIRVGPSQYEIRYSYDLRQGISGPKILPDGRTRDLCTDLINAGKLYTREEISRMNNGMGWNSDVFLYAGGYYLKPGDTEPTPYCRHAWYENIVIRK